MQKLNVYYCGFNQDWLLGTLASDAQQTLFEYSSVAIEKGLELSPIHFPVRPITYHKFHDYFLNLPGFIADSLPDGWGMLLMDRWFRRHGLSYPSSLNRLAFMADRSMGALRFEPFYEPSPEEQTDWDLLTLAKENQLFIEGSPRLALQQLVYAGGSPQGARPKALVWYDKKNKKLSTMPQPNFEAWLVKFPAENEHKEVAALEQVYAEHAALCGLTVPKTQWFDVTKKIAAFAVQRFDREGEESQTRVPLQSLAALLQVNFRLPGSVDYTAFLRATRILTHDDREVVKAFQLAVFNVLHHNRDDHSKNFAFLMSKKGRWRLAPAFDLTFSNGPMGQHSMDICGEAGNIDRNLLIKLATEGGLKLKLAHEIVDNQLHLLPKFFKRLKKYPILKKTVDRITQAVGGIAKKLW